MRRGVRLGVDVGSVRIGLAASDPTGILATPVRTIRRDPDRTARPPEDFAEIAAEVRERDAIEVVVGLPRSLSGKEGPAAATAREYATGLAQVLGTVAVRLVDERLTTVDAHRALRESGVSGRSQRAVVDQAAAVLILQTALDAERGSGRPSGELVGSAENAPGGAPRRPRKPRHRG